jgi:branched-chain amino acid transport system ATP-binding protein
MLKVQDLHAFYGKSHVLRGVSMEVKRGEIVSLLGRNGVGSFHCARLSWAWYHPRDTSSLMASCFWTARHDMAHSGLGYAPEDRAIFPALTASQNLELGMKKKRPDRRTVGPGEGIQPLSAPSCATPSAFWLMNRPKA